MFTGLVQAMADVLEVNPRRLVVTDPGNWPSDPWQLGESIAINGSCLTLIGYDQGLAFDLSQETWERTAFQHLTPGQAVNLERAMLPDTRFGGHIVQGHIDGVGNFLSSVQQDGAWVMRFEVPDGRYVIDKGSIALDGISLTAIRPENNQFDVAVVPHTYRHTSIGNLKPGQKVNVEYDVIARYVERLLIPR